MTCTATRRNGRPCAAQALPGKSHCFAHDPSLADKRQAAYIAGGHGKSNASRAHKRLPADLRDVLTKLLTALDEVHGEIDPRTAAAMASLAGAINRIYADSELEQRIAALENKR
jgi:hypothetical protein